MPKNIAIVGKMHAGKTTLATALVNHHGYTRVAMAGPLKALAHIAYGEIAKDAEYATVNKDSGLVEFKSGRQIYQEIGQSLKSVDRDIWLKCFISDTDHMDKAPYVVDDVRFIFEAEYLRSKGWFIVKVATPEYVRIHRAESMTGRRPTLQELNHESEREVDDIVVDYLYDGLTDLNLLGVEASRLIAAAG